MVKIGRQGIRMNIAIVYVYPATLGDIHTFYATRFLESYNRCPPGIEHQSIVVLNATKASVELTCMFSSLQNCMFLEHDDSGWDIGAFQKAAREVPCDLMVFFGGSTYIKSNIWMTRIRDSFLRHGDGLYGAMGNCGNVHVGGGVYPHLRTSGFWMSPGLFNSYPHRVTTPEHRYPFEHGPDGLTSWAIKRRLKTLEVTVGKELPLKQWSTDPNGYHHGNQSALLVGDRMTAPPFYHIP